MPLGANITLAELPEPELRQLFPHEELQIPVSCGGLGAGAGGRMDMRAVGLVPVRRASRYCTGFFVLIHSYHINGPRREVTVVSLIPNTE